MKILDGMIVQKIGDNMVAVPTEKAIDKFSGMVELNETGYDIWKGIEEGLSVEEIATKFTKEYSDVSYEDALIETNNLVDKLVNEGIVIK